MTSGNLKTKTQYIFTCSSDVKHFATEHCFTVNRCSPLLGKTEWKLLSLESRIILLWTMEYDLLIDRPLPSQIITKQKQHNYIFSFTYKFWFTVNSKMIFIHKWKYLMWCQVVSRVLSKLCIIRLSSRSFVWICWILKHVVCVSAGNKISPNRSRVFKYSDTRLDRYSCSSYRSILCFGKFYILVLPNSKILYLLPLKNVNWSKSSCWIRNKVIPIERVR